MSQEITISKFLGGSGTQKYLNDVLGSRKEKFVTNLASVVAQNKSLQECTNVSLMSGAIVATTLNLSLNKSFGYAYLVPFKVNEYNKQSERREYVRTEAQFQIGYKGYIQLAMRTGEYRRLNAVPIYENQFIRWNVMEEELSLNNVDGKGEVVGYVAFFELINGFKKTMYWRRDAMMEHADAYSSAFKASEYKKLQNREINQTDMWKFSSFWYKSFDDMGLKTMLRQILSKYGILSEEMENAYEFDQAVIIDNKPRYVDNEQKQQLGAPQRQPDPMELDVPVASQQGEQVHQQTKLNIDKA